MRTRNTKKRICAIEVAAPATPENPSTPAMIAMTRKVRAHPSMAITPFYKVDFAMETHERAAQFRWYFVRELKYLPQGI
jgi:hypothetical protein